MSGGLLTVSTAEELALTHMRTLGFVDVERTAQGRSEGVAVGGVSAAAVVRTHAVPVSVTEVRRLRGSAGSARRALYYAAGGYTTSALAWANEFTVSLFAYTADEEVSPSNRCAANLIRRATRLHAADAAAAHATRSTAFVGLFLVRWAKSDDRIKAALAALERSLRLTPHAGDSRVNASRVRHLRRETDRMWALAYSIVAGLRGDEHHDSQVGFERWDRAMVGYHREWTFNGLDLDDVLLPEDAFEWTEGSWKLTALWRQGQFDLAPNPVPFQHGPLQST